MAREREYTCTDCPPGAIHRTTGSGRLPERCETHRKARKTLTTRDGKNRRRRETAKGRLRVVEPAQSVAPAAPAAPDDPFASSEPAPPPGGVLKALRSDLESVFSEHPAAGTLTSVAEVLADVLDSPLVQADGRIAAAVSKELRAVVHELTSAKAAEEDDLFSTSVGPAVVGG